MPVYRYKSNLIAAAEIARVVPGPIVANPIAALLYEDITADAGSKDDLDDFMAAQGFTFVETDPITPQPAPATIAGDLAGTGSTSLLPRVGSLTGVAGTLVLAATAALFQWSAATVAPTISQAATGAATGATLSVLAQNALTTGGKLVLGSGTGVTAGDVEIQNGGVANLVVSPTAVSISSPLALVFPGASALSSVGKIRFPSHPGTILSMRNDTDTGNFNILRSFSPSYYVAGDVGCTYELDAFNFLLFSAGAPGQIYANTSLQILDAASALRLVIMTSIATAFLFAPACTSVDFSQSDAGNITAASWTIAAQSGVGGASVGGNLTLASGNGATKGDVIVRVGATAVAAFKPFELAFTAGSSALIDIATGGNAAGSILTVRAQSMVGGASTGGDLQVGGGTANTNGFVDFQNQALAITGTSIVGGLLLTGLLVQTLPCKVDGVLKKLLVLDP